MKGRIEADHRAIAGLFIADRLDHILNKSDGILKKLEDGYTVITDRFYFSSYAYHGAYMSMDWVIQSNSMSADILKPDINIYIDIEPEISMKRICNGRNGMELYETIETLRKVRRKYFEAIEKLKSQENIFTINGDKSPDIIAAEIWTNVSTILMNNVKVNKSES